MFKIIKSKTFLAGLAMFSMFFGAGNIIFPLAIGHYSQDKTIYAIIGLLLTAVVMPFSGLIAMFLFEGDYSRFFARIGKVPGFLVALLIMLLLGPLGSTPRCIALAYSTLKISLPNLSSVSFSAFATLLIFLFSYRKNRILDLLGYFLTPILLISLGVIIFKGFVTPGEVQDLDIGKFTLVLHGLREGYNTMDLLAAFFFSSLVLASLRKQGDSSTANRPRRLSLALKASLVGASLLALTYVGFSYIASFHGKSLNVSGNDELLGAIALKIMGPSAGLFVCLTVALACLTTAIALSNVFAEFLRKEIFNDKISYEASLAGSLMVTFFVSTFEFNGISNFLGPILQICYPALIVLTFLNIAYCLWKFQPVKIPVFAVFIASLIGYFYSGILL